MTDSASPRFVKQFQRHAAVAYAQARRLAEAGALEVAAEAQLVAAELSQAARYTYSILSAP